MSETVTKKKEPGMATLVIVLFAICAITALLLGLTDHVTAPYIAANNEKTTQAAMAAVLPQGNAAGMGQDNGFWVERQQEARELILIWEELNER